MDGFQLYNHVYLHWYKRLLKIVDALGQDLNLTGTPAGQSNILKAAGLAIQGAGSALYKTANTINYLIAGAAQTKAAAASQAFSQVLPVLPISSNYIFLVQVNAAGTLSTKVSPVVAGATGAVLPVADAGNVGVGYIWIATNGATTFTPGTTLLDAAGLTVVFQDFVNAPDLNVVTSYPHLPTDPRSGGVTCETVDTTSVQDSSFML